MTRGTPSAHRRSAHIPTQARKRKIAAKVYERDGYICQLCGRPVDTSLIGTNRGDAPSCDHIVAFKDGGRFTVDNLRLAHRRCNELRHAQPPVERRAA